MIEVLFEIVNMYQNTNWNKDDRKKVPLLMEGAIFILRKDTGVGG